MCHPWKFGFEPKYTATERRNMRDLGAGLEDSVYENEYCDGSNPKCSVCNPPAIEVDSEDLWEWFNRPKKPSKEMLELVRQAKKDRDIRMEKDSSWLP